MHFIIIKHDCAPVFADEAVSDELDVVGHNSIACLTRCVYCVYISPYHDIITISAGNASLSIAYIRLLFFDFEPLYVLTK